MKKVLIDITYLILNLGHSAIYMVILYIGSQKLSYAELIITYILISLLCSQLLALIFLPLYLKETQWLHHLEWISLLMRTHLFLNSYLISLLDVFTLSVVNEIFIQSYIIMVRIKDSPMVGTKCSWVYRIFYITSFGFYFLRPKWFLSIIEFVITLVFFLFMNYPKTFSESEELPAEKKARKSSRFLQSPKFFLDASLSSNIQSNPFQMDFYDSLPFGVAFIDTQCDVKYMNFKTSQMFQIADMLLLSQRLQTLTVPKIPISKLSSRNLFGNGEKQMSIYSVLFCSNISKETQTILVDKTNWPQHNTLVQDLFCRVLLIMSTLIFQTLIQYSIWFKPVNLKNSFQWVYHNGSKIILCLSKDLTWINGAQIDKSHFLIFFIDQQSYHKSLSRHISSSVMNQMFRSISHEFGTSLNCFLSLTESALTLVKDQNILQTIIQPSYDSCLILDSIVKDYRDYSQFLSKTFQLQIKEQVSISAQIKQIKQLFERQLEYKSIQLEIKIDPYLNDIITTDPQRLSQVLLNLVSNAQKHTYKGKVKIIVSKKQISENQYYKFKVKDTGIGMSIEKQKGLNDLLNLGVKQSPQTIEQSETYGLGLIISNMIAQKLSLLKRPDGGGIKFQTKHEVGSKFWFLVLDQKQLSFSSENWQQLLGQSKIFTMSKEKDREYLRGLSHTKVIQQPKQSDSSIQSDNLQRQSSELKQPGRSSFYKIQINHQQQKSQRVQFELDKTYPIDIDYAYEVPSEKIIQQESRYFDDSPSPLRVRNPALTPQKKRQLKKMVSFDLEANECVCNEILIVDDEYFNILALQIVLGTMSLKVDHAQNGKEAIHKYEHSVKKLCHCNKLYKLILMDINMPEVDGFMATKQILQLADEYHSIPPVIVAQTAFSDHETQTLSKEAGMSYFITKPISKKELSAIMRILYIIES